MNKVIVAAAVAGLIGLTSLVTAVVSSYGSITGAAVVRQAIGWDILESYSDVNTSATNDTHYQLETTYQGETKWVKVKIKNAADVALSLNISIANEKPADVTVTVIDENKSQPLANPIQIPTTGRHVWLRHSFSAAAEPGAYSFTIAFVPA